MRVATERVHAGTVTLGVWVDSGSRFETQEENGVSHFLEHLFFKGTSKRSQRELEEGVENIGGHLNAYTSREQVAYFGRFQKKDAQHGLGLIAEILLDSKLSAEAVERERGVILREMEEIENATEEVVFDYLHHTAFRGSSLSRTILGPRENIKSLTREDLLRYLKKHYTADRMVIAAAGDVDHAQVVDWAQSLFGGVAPSSSEYIEKDSAKFVGSDYRHRRDTQMSEAHVAYAFPVCGWTSPENYPLLVLQHYFGEYSSHNPYPMLSVNPLLQTLHDSGFASKCHAFSAAYSDVGLFGMYFVANPYKVDECMHVVAGSMTKACYSIDEPTFELAKKNALAQLVLSIQDTTAIADDIGRQVSVYGRRIHPIEIRERINMVTKEDVLAVAHKYFYDRDFAMAAFGPIYGLPDYNQIRNLTFSKFR